MRRSLCLAFLIVASGAHAQIARVDVRGHGPVDMILIPSGGFSGSVFETFMSRNADLCTCYAITQSGYGGTPAPELPATSYEARTWALGFEAALERLIRDRHLHRPVIVGHSLLGDYHALRFALDHPKDVGAAIILAGAPSMRFVSRADRTKPATPEDRAAYARQYAEYYEKLTDEQWKKELVQAPALSMDRAAGEQLFEQLELNPRATMLRYYLEVMTADLSPELSHFPVPLLVLEPMPDETSFVRPELRPEWKTRNPWVTANPPIANLTIRYIDHARRFVMIDQPEQVRQTIVDFLAERLHGHRYRGLRRLGH